MIRVLLPLCLLAGCAAAPPATRIVTITPQIPAALLHCADSPPVPDAATQAVVARFIVDLWQAGQDCRAHVAAIAAALPAATAP